MRCRETKYGIFPDLYFIEYWTWINTLLFAILTY